MPDASRQRAPAGNKITLTTATNANVLAIPTTYNQVASYPTPNWWPPVNWPQTATWATSPVLIAQTTNVDFTGGFGNSTLWPVQPGDYLTVKGASHLILLVSPTALVLAPVAPFQPPGSATASGSTISFTP